jgi:hypothetical protein
MSGVEVVDWNILAHETSQVQRFRLEAGLFLGRLDFGITQLKDQGLRRTYIESKREEEEASTSAASPIPMISSANTCNS